MEYPVEISPRASREAQAIYERIAVEAPRTAEKWYGKLLEKIATLSTLPERFSLTAESESLGWELRELLYGKRHNIYRILFVVREHVVEVLSVRHAQSGPFKP